MIPGAMDYLPNVEGALWFHQEVWPLVQQAVPAAQLHLVGRDPVPEICALAADPSIVVSGRVPSMLPWYRQSRVVCAPIRIGGGSRLKVVEAWSVGRPLVATHMAVDGLAARHGVNALLSDDPQTMADHLVASLTTSAGENLRQASLNTAPSYYWQAITGKLSTIMQQLTASRIAA